MVLRNKEYPGLIIGLISVSFAAIFIKLADAPPSVVSALRMIFATLLVIPYALFSSRFKVEIRQLTRREMALLFLSGVLLSLHFLAWITSLSLTGITSSIVFVTTSPLFVALFSVLIMKEKVTRSFWAGLIISTAGILIMAGGNILNSDGFWKGAILAVAGAVAAAGYFIVGGRLRVRLSLITYILPVYLTAAVILSIAVPLSGERFSGHHTGCYIYCFLMAAVCQLAGHTVFNWALRRVRATIVTLAILGEPVGTTLLAYFILEKVPAVAEVAGGVFVLAGIFTAINRNQRLTP